MSPAQDDAALSGGRQTELPAEHPGEEYTRLFDPPHATATEIHARDTFTALMWALSYPGRVSMLPVQTGAIPDNFAACLAVGQALLDLETSYYTAHPALAQALAHTSARALPPAEASYHFYPDATLEPAMLDAMRAARIGNYLYPDQAATLMIGCKLDSGAGMTFQGPGIAGELSVHIGGLPDGFWQLRAETIHYPLGWDIFLIDGDRVLGLPRTTIVRAI